MNKCISVVSTDNPVGLRSLNNHMVGKEVLGIGSEEGLGGFQEVVLAPNLQRQSIERHPGKGKAGKKMFGA